MKCWGKIKSFFKRPKAKAKVEEPEAKAAEEKAARVPKIKVARVPKKKADSSGGKSTRRLTSIKSGFLQLQ